MNSIGNIITRTAASFCGRLCSASLAAAGSASLLPSQLIAAPAAQAPQPKLRGSSAPISAQDDLSVPGREVIQALVEFPRARRVSPGIRIQAKNSPTSTEGALEYAARRQAAGDRQGRRGRCSSRTAVPHAVKNVGTGNAAELATYFVGERKAAASH